MRGGWSTVLWVVVMLQMLADTCFSLNLEGRALLRFRSAVEVDPHGALRNWDAKDGNPCNWSGVQCIDGKVDALNLKKLSLGGTLTPELGKLNHLRYLVLSKNRFSGAIPKEIAGLTMLEVLDVSSNDLSGTVPTEMGEMSSIKHLLLSGNKFQGLPQSLEKFNVLPEENFYQILSFDVDSEIVCINRKIGCCIWQSGLQQLEKADSSMTPLIGKLLQFLEMLNLLKFKMNSSSIGRQERNAVNIQGFTKPYDVHNAQLVNFLRRKLLQETSNLAAAPISGAVPQEVISLPSMSSGSFPAVTNLDSGKSKVQPFKPNITSIPPPVIFAKPLAYLPTKPTETIGSEPSFFQRKGNWVFILILPGVAILAVVASMLACRTQGVAAIRPWKTGLSGQLQKAFVSGVPKVNRSELEAACEDFSNIVSTYPEYTVFKGTLSTGVEIGVLSTAISSAKDWPKRSEMCYRKKIDMLSRVNHKNFVNLLGYCDENEPFMRMMVFEYVPNGTLSEHLHVKDFEHLDWNTRMRIIMGAAYCLQYMHHELNPPLALYDLQSTHIFMTDDYAAKVADSTIFKEVPAKKAVSGDYDADPLESLTVDPGSNVYSFGILMLEVISGRRPYSEEEGSLLNWAKEYLNESRNVRHLVDPTLKSFKNEELEIIVEVIQECIHQDPKNRPTMKEVISKLREVIEISPEAASPRLSPLWWAELEILSVEAT